MEENIKFTVCLFVFPQKKEPNPLCHPVNLSEAWFFSLVSEQIISGYLLLCMACKYGQLCHFIRHNPFQVPGEPVSTDDFHSSGKAVSYQSASVPAYVRTWMLERKPLRRLLPKLQNVPLKNTELYKPLTREMNVITLNNAEAFFQSISTHNV